MSFPKQLTVYWRVWHKWDCQQIQYDNSSCVNSFSIGKSGFSRYFLNPEFAKKMPTQITQIANCKLWPTSQSTRKTWHPNPHLAPLVGLCSVSAGYLIGGWASSPILIIRHLAFTKSARLYVFQNPKSWQNSYLLAICVVCVSIFSCKQSTLITKKSWINLS